jgi:hypothetical protein
LLTDRTDDQNADQGVHSPDLMWTPALQRNKWPLKVSDAAPTYSDS